MTKDIRKNINATIKLNGSLEEGPVGWTASKLAKAGGRIASKFTGGATKQRIKQNVDVRSGAEQLIKRWNAGFGGRKMLRTPGNIIRFLAKDNDMNMSNDQLRTAWNRTSQLTRNFGTYDEVINQLKKQPPGERREQSQTQAQSLRREKAAPPISAANYPESVEEAIKIPATQKMSVNNLRNLLINAIHVKNEADAEKELGDFPGTEEPKVVAPKEPKAEPKPKPTPRPEPSKPSPEAKPDEQPIVKDLKKAGAQDMDNDGDYDWDDLAKIAVAQGKGEEALSSIMKAISPEKAALVKAILKGQIR